MEKESGGVSAALTKEEFQAIRNRREYAPGSPMARLMTEVERLHPEWIEPRWRMSCSANDGRWTNADTGRERTLDEVVKHLEANKNDWKHTFQRVLP